jgi:Ni,Fe-hydrogenase III component G
MEVDPLGIGFDQIAPGVSDQVQSGQWCEHPAESGQVGIQRMGSPDRRMVLPDAVNQRLKRYEPVRVDRQDREQGSLSGITQINSRTVQR